MPAGKMLLNCILLRNLCTTMNASQNAGQFNILPPTLAEYCSQGPRQSNALPIEM